ncbi:hypothetical protein [Galbibacter pacificus]|uniref:Uncharacterized protein n=1 Tax=Galbibacter pacificus TaxID=2996052 RepID=A0ABT6FR76_9FLAO|nr:hypothetical protein [Galbibacter pacificus]MDG3581756.1 hypothetical protein [Galbibacter pacificus]MDG3585770.1 hypothetical protein [Galbibacter pacificus]
MVEEILIIENKQVDLIPKTITRNIQLNNLGNVTNKQSSYSQSIKLPKTTKNTKIFEFLGVVGNQSTAPYKKLKCTYYCGGVCLVNDGYAVVNGTTDMYYNIVIYNGIITLATALQGKTMADLDYSYANHTLSENSYKDGLLSDNTLYQYPVVDYSDWEYTNIFPATVQIDKQYPMLRVKQLFKNIFTQSDLIVTGDYIDETIGNDEITNITDAYNITDAGGGGDTALGSFATNTITKNVTDGIAPIHIENDFNITSNSLSSPLSVSSNKITCNSNNKPIQFTCTFTCTCDDGIGTIRITKNNVTIDSFQFDDDITETNYEVNTILNNGDDIGFELISVSNGSYDVVLSARINGTAKEIAPSSYDVNIISNSEITQLDYIKDVMNRYGLLINYNALNNTYELKNIDNLITDFDNADNWTTKYQSSEGELYKSSYYQKNNFKFNYDENYIDEPLDGYFTINNPVLAEQKEIYTSVFNIAYAGTRQFKTKSLYRLPLLNYDEDNDKLVAKEETSPLYLFKLKRGLPSTFNARLLNDTPFSVTASPQLIGYVTLEDTSMQYYLDTYYNKFIQLLQNYKEVKMKMKLSIVDIYNFSFYKLIFLEQTGKYYFINNIRFNPNKPISDVVLVEIPFYV